MKDAAQKAAMVARGLCRQCGARRLDSPSKSRCRKCLDTNRKDQQRRYQIQTRRKGT